MRKVVGFFEELFCLFSVEHALIQSVSGLMLRGLRLHTSLGVSSTVSFGGQRSPHELTVLASRPLEKHMVVCVMQKLCCPHHTHMYPIPSTEGGFQNSTLVLQEL